MYVRILLLYGQISYKDFIEKNNPSVSRIDKCIQLHDNTLNNYYMCRHVNLNTYIDIRVSGVILTVCVNSGGLDTNISICMP